MSNPQHNDTDPTLHELVESRADADDHLVGTNVSDRYLLEQRLGKGAMGVVYKAVQLSDQKPVALKVLHTHLASDPDAIRRFQQEAKAASSLMHPHIVRLYDVGMMPSGQPYIAMEFVEGITLSEVIRDKRYFDTKETLSIMIQVCEALTEAHSHGVLHRDIKPANIMLVKTLGQDQFVIVVDFSISKVIQKVSDVDTTTPGVILGSPAYMSPERFSGSSGDFRADIYSVGIILFQMLAGRAPFKSAVLAKLMNDHINTAPPRVQDMRPGVRIPETLEATIAKALAKRPEDRHANVKELLAELEESYRTICAPAFATEFPSETLSAVPAPSQPELVQIDSKPSRQIYSAANTTSLSDIVVNTLQAKAEKSTYVSNITAGRPAIRPPEKSSFISKELMALIGVAAIGLGTIVARLVFVPSVALHDSKHAVREVVR